MSERCAICECRLHRKRGTYAKPTLDGRSHATDHHLVPERFFGRSANRRGIKLKGVFDTCPWGYEGKTVTFCYECHEELLHNPVLLPQELECFAKLVRERGLAEEEKTESRVKMAGRIELFHEVISRGLVAVAAEKHERA